MENVNTKNYSSIRMSANYNWISCLLVAVKPFTGGLKKWGVFRK
jgi:hypothetical protein